MMSHNVFCWIRFISLKEAYYSSQFDGSVIRAPLAITSKAQSRVLPPPSRERQCRRAEETRARTQPSDRVRVEARGGGFDTLSTCQKQDELECGLVWWQHVACYFDEHARLLKWVMVTVNCSHSHSENPSTCCQVQWSLRLRSEQLCIASACYELGTV